MGQASSVVNLSGILYANCILFKHSLSILHAEKVQIGKTNHMVQLTEELRLGPNATKKWLVRQEAVLISWANWMLLKNSFRCKQACKMCTRKTQMHKMGTTITPGVSGCLFTCHSAHGCWLLVYRFVIDSVPYTKDPTNNPPRPCYVRKKKKKKKKKQNTTCRGTCAERHGRI